MRCRIQVPALVLAVLVAILEFTPASADDGIVLTVDRDLGTGDISLGWAGGAPVYEVLRAVTPQGLLDPSSLVEETDGTLWVDPAPGGTVFYRIVTRGGGCPAGNPECEAEPNDSCRPGRTPVSS